MSYPDILYYCDECETETQHFNLPSLLTANGFQCTVCLKEIILQEGTEVVFLHYNDLDDSEDDNDNNKNDK